MTGRVAAEEITNPLLTLIELGHRARTASSPDELAFLAVNDTRALIPYRQAALWFRTGGVRTLSGVVEPEGNAPYAQWLNRLCQALDASHGTAGITRISAADVPEEVAREWHEWLPAEAVWLPFPASPEHPGSTAGGLLLAGDAAPDEAQFPLLTEWIATWRHAWLSRFWPSAWSLPALWERLRAWRHASHGRKWWRRRPVQIALLLLASLLLPVRLTVLAPGELVPANPAVIRAPLDGVIGQFHVRPNEAVKAGQLLFTFDEAPLATRVGVARQALATAEVEYRQLAQIALSDTKSKGQLAVLLGKIGEKQAEAEYLQSQFDRSRVVAPQDGVAIFDDPSEWIGRPVQTGERVMKVAASTDVEIEAWLPIGNAIPLRENAPVHLYLAATPFTSLPGQVRYLSHDAVPRPDGSYAYRLRARLTEETGHRIGLKGTTKVYGEWVPLAYWVLRRPLASIRQFIGF